MRFQILGVDRTINHLMGYSNRIKEDLLKIVPEIGMEVETKLKKEFPQAQITGEFDATNLSYQIKAYNIVICDVTGFLILTAVEKQSAYKGKGYFESSRELDEYVQDLVNFYLNQARERINLALMEILK